NMLDRSKGTPTPGDTSLVRVPMQDTYIFSKNQKALRADYNFSSKANFFFHWVDDAQQESQGLGIFSGNSYPNSAITKPSFSFSNLSTSQVLPFCEIRKRVFSMSG